MAPRISCPTCGMSASWSDLRHFQPIRDEHDRRSCRNCGDEVWLEDPRAIERLQDPSYEMVPETA